MNTNTTQTPPQSAEPNPIGNLFANARARAATDARRRTGKIARLPAELRAWINQALLDGASYQDIRLELERKGFPDINDGCLTSWFQGGYQDWLRSAEYIDQCKAFSEHACRMGGELKNDAEKIADLNETLVAAQLTRCLYTLAPRLGDENRTEAIEDFLRVARTVNQQARERSIRHRAQLETRKYNDQLEAKTESPTLPNPETSLAT
ncbi:MAG: hypothetical protein JWO95_2814 [Verrucomicrobiales bacterium]|nr:hypothetical protein [Verrucomicrobiales bacterium]